jgi:hypothetical protein
MVFSLPSTVKVRPVRQVAVYKGLQLVLLAENKPGYLISTAMPAPNTGAPQHPFIHGEATWAPAEDELGSLLHASESFDAFLAALVAHGYDLLSVEDKVVAQQLDSGYRIYHGDRHVATAWPMAGQWMTLQQQPALGELRSAFATVTAYDPADAEAILQAFQHTINFVQFSKSLNAKGFWMEESW